MKPILLSIGLTVFASVHREMCTGHEALKEARQSSTKIDYAFVGFIGSHCIAGCARDNNTLTYASRLMEQQYFKQCTIVSSNRIAHSAASKTGLHRQILARERAA
ncbi:hypothetical protein DER46DRAFT_156875 [Fusarium sp. MPI-SDFR-AT-0072]|nr:hypothetical protein DER46DRAFT_156875 [Fusarium sp. MPI-SDFR-AT-0072]